MGDVRFILEPGDNGRVQFDETMVVGGDVVRVTKITGGTWEILLTYVGEDTQPIMLREEDQSFEFVIDGSKIVNVLKVTVYNTSQQQMEVLVEKVG